MNKELTLEVAREMYNSGNDMMKAFALESFSEEELQTPINNNQPETINNFPITYEEAVKQFDYLTRIGFNLNNFKVSEIYKDKTWPDYIWVSDVLNNENNVIEYCGAELVYLSCLIIIRNAWWKLDNNWTPDWTDKNTSKYIITSKHNNITLGLSETNNYILSFRTELLRDSFYHYFNELINKVVKLI